MGCLCASFTEGGERDNERISLHYTKKGEWKAHFCSYRFALGNACAFWDVVWVKLIQDVRGMGGILAACKPPSDVDANPMSPTVICAIERNTFISNC